MPSLALLTTQALHGDLAATRRLLANLGQMLLEQGNGNERNEASAAAGDTGRMLVAACSGDARAAWLGGWRYGKGVAQAWSMDGVGGMLLRSFDGKPFVRIPTQGLWTPGESTPGESTAGGTTVDGMAPGDGVTAALAGEYLDCDLAHDDLDFLVPPGSLAALYVTGQGKAFVDHDPGVLGLARDAAQEGAPPP